jgi:UDP-glucose 4-epimerase
MEYLVTGGAGFIGSHLCDALINRGDSVVVLDNFSTGSKKNIKHLINNPNFQLVDGSVLNYELVDKLISTVDHVLHLAAAVGVFNILTKPLESLITNLNGTENILEACLRHKKEVLIASSSEIYGKNSEGPLNEESDRIIGSPLKSRWSYSEAKAIDESMAYFYFTERQLKIRIARFFNTVGPRQVGDYGMVVPRFVSAALKNETIRVYGSGKQSRCFCHVLDAVNGLLAIIDSNKTIGQAFNIGNNEEITIQALAKEVVDLTNSKSSIENIPYEKAFLSGFEDMERRIPDISKINRITGWSPNFSLIQIIKDISMDMKSENEH